MRWRGWASPIKPAAWVRTPCSACDWSGGPTTSRPWPWRPRWPGRWPGRVRRSRPASSVLTPCGAPGRPSEQTHPPRCASPPAWPSRWPWPVTRSGARNLAEDTVQRAGRTLGADHPLTLSLSMELALTLVWTGGSERPGRADDTLPRILRALGPGHRSARRAALYLEFVRTASTLPAPVVDMAESTWRRASLAFGRDHPATHYLQAILALALARSGDPERARTLAGDVLQDSPSSKGARPRDAARDGSIDHRPDRAGRDSTGARHRRRRRCNPPWSSSGRITRSTRPYQRGARRDRSHAARQ